MIFHCPWGDGKRLQVLEVLEKVLFEMVGMRNWEARTCGEMLSDSILTEDVNCETPTPTPRKRKLNKFRKPNWIKDKTDSFRKGFSPRIKKKHLEDSEKDPMKEYFDNWV